MSDKHPYISGTGGLVQTINQFRKSFPATVNAGTLQKLGYAPNNETYVLNTLRFLGLLDDEGKRTDAATKVFNLHDDAQFSKGFGELVNAAYKDLFDLHKEAAWALDADSLITFFRSNDDTSAIVGKRQASTFQLLAAFSGHGDVPQPRASGKKSNGTPKPKAVKKPAGSAGAHAPTDTKTLDLSGRVPEPQPPVGLSVRIEVNLPADGDQETYDRIFKSIRENLLNG